MLRSLKVAWIERSEIQEWTLRDGSADPGFRCAQSRLRGM